MLSILFLASVVNANTHFSLPENFKTTTQKLTTQLHTTALNYARRHTRRLRDTSSACAWDNDECTLSPDFIASAAAKDKHSPIKQLAAKSAECSVVKEQAACTGDCAYKSGKCDVSEKASATHMQSILKESSDTCGPLAEMMQGDECTSITSETACTNTCEWHKSGDYELDATSNTCKAVPECKKKSDPNDPLGMNKMCPNMEVVKAECEAKGDDKAKLDCFDEKCPMLLIFIGAMGCGSSTTEDKCKSYYGGSLCAWKDTKKCEMNMDFVLDRLVPEDCWLRPMIEESFVCGQEKTADTCAQEESGKCEWQKKPECQGAGAPKTKEECAGNGQSMMAALLGDHAARQQDACRKATSMSKCTSIEAIPDDQSINTATSAIVSFLTVCAGVLAV